MKKTKEQVVFCINFNLSRLRFIFYILRKRELKKKYKAILYQIDKNKVEYLILFFSKDLLDVEIKY